MNSKININYSPLKINSFSFSNLNNSSLEFLLVGHFHETPSLQYSYLNYDMYNIQTKIKTCKYFEYWNYSLSNSLNTIIKKEENSSFIFDCEFSLLSFNPREIYLIDKEQYIKPSMSKDKKTLFGLVSYAGMKTFDIPKKKGEIIYPGKNTLINDYIWNENKIIMTTDNNQLAFYDIRDGKSLFSSRTFIEFDILCWGDNNYQTFYAFSEEYNKLYLYDYRNLNFYIKECKKDIIITQMEFCAKKNCSYFLEEISDKLIVYSENCETEYKTDSYINKFYIDETEEYIGLLKNGNQIEIINNDI